MKKIYVANLQNRPFIFSEVSFGSKYEVLMLIDSPTFQALKSPINDLKINFELSMEDFYRRFDLQLNAAHVDLLLGSNFTCYSSLAASHPTKRSGKDT